MIAPRPRVPKVLHIDDAELLMWRGGETRVIVRGEHTQNTYAALLVSLDSGQNRAIPCPSEIGYYVLQGALSVLSGQQEVELQPGGFINIPRHTPHEVFSRGSDTALFITILAPAIEDFWIDDPEMVPIDKAEMSQTRVPTFAGPRDGRKVTFMGDHYTFKVVGEGSMNSYTLWEAVLEPGSSQPLHLNTREEEALFVIEGTLSLQAARKTFSVGPGTWVNFPRQWMHSIRNEGTTPVKALMLVAPSGYEELLFAIAASSVEGEEDRSSKDIEQFGQLGPRYGIEGNS